MVQVAIIRPGPIVGKMLHPYLRRRQGLEAVTYPHPALQPVLERTLGVPLFQEQLLRMAMIVAGFTGGQAEELRRAMGFKRSEKRMQEIEGKLRAGMTRNGIAADVQDLIVRSIGSFAAYGFPESHAASFALLAYASAYLKCHYLAAFTAAMLNNQPMGFYHPATLVKDAQRHGLHFKPIDVMRSDWKCTMDERHAASAWASTISKACGAEAAARIIEERAREPFTSIRDLVRRVPDLRKEELNALAQAGALNFIGGEPSHRREALWRFRTGRAARGRAARSRRRPAQIRLRSPPCNPRSVCSPITARPGSPSACIPCAFIASTWIVLGVIPAAGLGRIPDGVLVRVAGSVICRQRPGTAKGFVFVSLEDETGIANAIVMPDLFHSHQLTIVDSPFLLIEGMLQNQRGSVSVKASRVESLRGAVTAAGSHDFH